MLISDDRAIDTEVHTDVTYTFVLQSSHRFLLLLSKGTVVYGSVYMYTETSMA